MPKEKPDILIDEIINFLEDEREMFGDFTVSSQQLHNLETETEAKIAPDKSGEEGETKQAAAQSTDQYSAPEIKYFDPTNELFNSGENRKIYHRIHQCNTLGELEALCRKAAALETDLADTQLVFGVGNPHADLMLIGEAPGAEDDKQGEPFVGKAGKLLNKIMAAINFERDDIYIANILKHRPPQNRNPKPEAHKRSLPFLLRQMDLIEPKLILCLGRASANTLLNNKSSLDNLRQKLHPYRKKYELMATYHPATLLRNPNRKRPTWEDVQQLRDRYDELECKP